MIILCDDSDFVSQTVNNFVWVTFTRANPANDVHGINAKTIFKHWSCDAMVIDARIKPHHAPELIPDKKISERVDRFFARDGELSGIIHH